MSNAPLVGGAIDFWTEVWDDLIRGFNAVFNALLKSILEDGLMKKILVLIGMFVVLAFLLQKESQRLFVFADASFQPRLGEIIAICEGQGHFVLKKAGGDELDYSRKFLKGDFKKEISQKDNREFYQSWVHPRAGKFISLEALPLEEIEKVMGKEACPELLGEVFVALAEYISEIERSGRLVLFIDFWREDDYLKTMIITRISASL